MAAHSRDRGIATRIRRALRHDPDRHNAAIAASLGTTNAYVRKVRRGLESKGRIDRVPFLVMPSGKVVCRVAPGPAHRYLRRQLTNLRWLTKCDGRPEWRDAPPALRREFWSLAEAWLERMGRSIDPASGELLHGGLPRGPRPRPGRAGPGAQRDRPRPG